MCNMRLVMRNSHNLPYESPNFRNYFFLGIFLDNLGTSQKPFFPKYVCFLLYTPGGLGTCVFGVTHCALQKRVSVQLLHDQMMLDISLHVILNIGLLNN